MSDRDPFEDDKPLALDAWEAQEPPPGFAERVLARLRAEDVGAEAGTATTATTATTAATAATATTTTTATTRARRSPRSARRWGYAGGAVAALAVAAAMAVKIGGAPPAHGEAIAKDRLEVSIGDRARAVLEPGAEVRWDGDDVVQAKGDVFYRVEPGARFRVHTGAGDVEVKGTCFAVKVRGERGGEGVDMQKRDVKSAAAGAALSALAFVAVYEGKVAVSHAGQRVDVAAGESAQLGAEGVARTGAPAEGQQSFEAAALAKAAIDEPLASANENLVSQVSDYKRRLETIAQQKDTLEKQLHATEEKLAAAGDGAAPRTRSKYDLDKDDWVQLAKEGRVRYRTPCLGSQGWTFPPEKLNQLGLAPQDGAVLHDAYERSYQRIWATVRPLCMQALGSSSAEIIDKIGPAQCIHLVYDLSDHDAAAEAMTEAAEIRAGLRPEPAQGAKIHPVLKMFLALTSANQAFEADLAKSFGPEDAHRLAYSEDMCNSNNSWGGGKKRGPVDVTDKQ